MVRHPSINFADASKEELNGRLRRHPDGAIRLPYRTVLHAAANFPESDLGTTSESNLIFTPSCYAPLLRTGSESRSFEL